ncbi:hypothetical protein CN553_12725 [Bacillus cereus]|uniref:Uncharacterized protein n=2 Tax=Bacillus cereus TaxID=1396 RepID=A0A9X6UC82_BACCE|nr:hypothetical protein [Bacillus cereus]EOO44219.1 hypothetical protein ICK_06476 [Bacillus cereus BAG1X2-2]EOP00382.1 hypothetical protein ICO_06338 [Bacillus cereus BAG2O-1]PEN97895.1 hypothetical protein CN553_12725 [Bacillus cereus]
MIRKSFTDMDGKKGQIGSIVRNWMNVDDENKNKTVKEIISKGAGGTRIYFEEGGYDKSSHCKIIRK